MRDFASCFSEHAINVKVSNASCLGSSSSSGGSSNCGKLSTLSIDQSVQTSITCLYLSTLAARNDVLIKVTWSKTHIGAVLSIGVDSNLKVQHWKQNSSSSHILRKRKGTRSYISDSSVIGLYWDYSAAKFNSSPEPVSNFYVVVIVDAELALLLGDLSTEFIKRSNEKIPVAGFTLVSQREQVLGHSVYSTTARFGDGGKDHDIVIKCKGDGSDSKESELVVSIDRKRVMQVRRLQWNFRGNQTIFVDGSPVDVMWDIGNWWFCSPPGHAVFMFQRRSTLQNRLWLEEEMLHKDRGVSGFSLSIQAFKNP